MQKASRTKKDHPSSSRTTGDLVTKSLRFLTKRAADWYKIGTGTRKFTFYGILSDGDTFDFCVLLLNRLHRGDVARTGSVIVRQTPTTSTK